MAPRGRKKLIGLRREDAARDRMKEYGFEKHVINASIKQVLEVYGEDQWFLIEGANYAALLSICLEKQEEQANQLAAEEQEEMGQVKQEEEEKEADALSITNEAVMDSSPPAFQFVEASVDYARHSVGGAKSPHCGWLSSEEETDTTSKRPETTRHTDSPTRPSFRTMLAKLLSLEFTQTRFPDHIS